MYTELTKNNTMMKKMALLLISVLLLTNCKKVKDEIDRVEMSAKINGSEWKSTVRNSTSYNDKFIITGTSIDGKLISITVFGTIEGEYSDFGEYVGLYKESLSATTEDSYTAISGEVIITDINTTKKEISGTFNFEMIKLGASNASITEGKFTNLTYIEAEDF